MKIRNIYLVFLDQLPLERLWRNLRKGHLKGLLHARSHFTHGGTPKVTYNTKPTAEKAAKTMSEKTGHYFSNYKCLHCDGYHIGKNRDKSLYHPDQAEWESKT
jgi:hypothetical protein